MDDDIYFQPLGSSLATINETLVYTEAKRQYEALCISSANSARLTRWRVDLQAFYQLQFEQATEDLDAEQKWKLLTICFAYKTRDGVLRYLDHVLDDAGDAAFDWVQPIRTVVHRSGKTTMFEDATAHVSATSLDSNTKTDEAAMSPPQPEPAAQGTSTTPTPAPCFTIPTLPLAYPKHFYLALASLAPLHHLSLTHLLAHPAVHGLKLCRPLKHALRNHHARKTGGVAEDGGWRAFWDALIVGRAELFAFPAGREGYGAQELAVWVERWRGEREGRAWGEGGEEEDVVPRAGTAGGESGAALLAVREGEGERAKKRVRWMRTRW